MSDGRTMVTSLRNLRTEVGLRSRPYRWRESARAGVLPAFIILGAQKAGTTSLYEYLCQHPQIVSARRKEVHFFDESWERGVPWYRSTSRPPMDSSPGR